MAGFRWQRGSGNGSIGRIAARPDGLRVANDSRPEGARVGAGARPLDDILAAFLPGATAEVIDLAAHRSGRRGAWPRQPAGRRSRT